MAWMTATASTAPAAPSRCPMRLLVLLMRKLSPGRAFLIALYSAMSPTGVEVPWAFT